MVHLALNPHGIAPTFLNWIRSRRGRVLFLLYTPQGNKSDKERKIVRKKLSFMHTTRSNTLFKKWVQFRVGAIPSLPVLMY